MQSEPLAGLSNAKEKVLARLTHRKYRQEEGLFLAEGLKLVGEALERGAGIEWAVASETADKRAAELVRLLLERGVQVYRASEKSLVKNLDLVTPQALTAVCVEPRLSLPDLVPGARSLVVVSDNLREPGNLGALIRVAAASGAAALLAGPGTVDPYNSKCVRGSMGAIFRLPVFRVGREELKNFMESRNFGIYAAAAEGENVFALDKFPSRTALILGSEAAGPTEFTSGLGARLLGVPMAAGVESLNVAVAAGILLYRIAEKVSLK